MGIELVIGGVLHRFRYDVPPRLTPDGFCDHGGPVTCSAERHALIRDGKTIKDEDGQRVPEPYEDAFVRALTSTIQVPGAPPLCRCCRRPI